MKKLIMIGGTMGVGKSATCKALSKKITPSVFLDGDWCWDMHPFLVNEETKTMVLDNITHLLQNFIQCSAYEYVIFGWVMHEQAILDAIVSSLDLQNVELYQYSLVCDEAALTSRIQKDIEQGLRKPDVIARSLARMAAYQNLATIKIDTSDKTIDDVVKLICDDIT